jgi:hypothetical protein
MTTQTGPNNQKTICCTDVAGNLGLVKLPKKMLGKLQGIVPVDGLMTTDQ